MTRGESAGDRRPVVAVVGLGLMGGSLCRRLSQGSRPPLVLASDRDAIQCMAALESGVVDRVDPDPAAVVSEADVVVYAVPLGATMELLREHAGLWREDALVTDMVSLKGPLLRAAARGGFADRFVGAHPICGGEASGFGAGRADLFEGARVWLCADPSVSEEFRSRAFGFWQGVGGEAEWIDAEEHDRKMAWVSHLPQLVANALAGALDAAGHHPSELGPGGRDMTRLAGSNPEIWRDLLEASAPVTGTGLTSVSNALNVLADLLARRDVDRIAEFMERTRNWRNGSA
jgi:prephenate dehydrogenase